MRNLPVLLIFFLIFTGCAKRVYVPVETRTTIKETVRDTVIDVKLGYAYVSRVTSDTVSVVETEYAASTAIWHAGGGSLEHSITNKAGSIPVSVKYVDREVTISRPEPYPIEVEVPVNRDVRMPLRWYEKALQGIGITALISLTVFVFVFVRFRK